MFIQLALSLIYKGWLVSLIADLQGMFSFVGVLVDCFQPIYIFTCTLENLINITFPSFHMVSIIRDNRQKNYKFSWITSD